MKSCPKYKGSGIGWIGDIPAHWSVKRFKEFASTTKGKGTDYLDIPTAETKVVLTLETLRQDNPTFFNYAIVKDEEQHCKTDDLIVIWDGAGVGEFLKAKDGVLSSTIAKINVDESKVLKQYLWYWRYKIEYCLKQIPTGMGIPHLNPTLLNQFMVAVPPSEEQHAIAAYLDEKCGEIDGQVDLLEKKRKAYERLKTSVINNAVTRGLNPDVSMQESGIDWIGKIPAHWSIKRFKEFASTTKGKGVDYLDEPTSETDVVLTLETLRQDKPTFFNYAIVNDRAQHCTTDDIVVIWDGAGVGEFLKAKGGILSSTIAKINVDESKVLKQYLWQWRYKIEYRLKQIPTGMGIPHLNPTLLNQYMLAVPPIDEQRAIAAYLDEKCGEIDATIENIGKQIDAYKRLKRALINEVVTGKRAV